MADKIKKISVNKLEEAMSNCESDVSKMEWNGLEITVKRSIGFQDMLQLYKRVVDNCFSSDTNEYLPSVKHFLIKAGIIEYYTNLTMPKNIKTQYDIVYKYGLFEALLEKINMHQVDEIIEAIDSKLDALVRTNEGLVTAKFNQLMDSMDGIVENVTGLFSGISNDDITGLARAISNNSITEEGLARAFLNSGTKSE